MVRRGLPTFRAVYDHLKKDALSFFALSFRESDIREIELKRIRILSHSPSQFDVLTPSRLLNFQPPLMRQVIEKG